MTITQDIVARLWNLCHVLRDDGVSYHEYVTELTFLLFLKMAQEIGIDESSFPTPIAGGIWRGARATSSWSSTRYS
jgi:type I restriction enzyme M protein